MGDVYSMTGYGRGMYAGENLRLKIELRSLNNRYLDINFRMPKLLFALEDKMRSAISSSIERGKVDIYVDLRRGGEQETKLSVKEGLLTQYLEIFEQLYVQGKIASRPDPSSLAAIPELFELEEISDPALFEEPLLETLKEALKNLKDMRQVEGNHLREEIASKSQQLRERMEEIEALAPEILTLYKDAM